MTTKKNVALFSAATLASAALSGLISASAYAAPASNEGINNGKMIVANAGAAAEGDHDKAGKHDCKGKNECKGKGGCKGSDAGCKGKNSCKGKGGCNTHHE